MKEIVPGQRALLMHREDNVAVAIQDLKAGERIEIAVGGGRDPIVVEVLQPIFFGHKVALKDIPAGGEIRKYGELMGLATTAIRKGEHVHIHNVESTRARGDRRQGSGGGIG